MPNINKYFIAFSLISLICTSTSAYPDDHAPKSVAYKAQKLNSKISVLFGKGGNVGVLSGDQGLILVDNDYADMSAPLKTALAKYEESNKIKYVINTHYHGDHTGNNKDFGKTSIIVAHDNVRKRLLSETEIKLFKMKSAPYVAHALPSITYNKRLSIHANGEHIDITHFPSGHTDGDSIVFFKDSNIVHMGDHFFNGMFPFVDVDNGGDVEQLAKNVSQVLGMIDKNTQIIPGHGPVSNKKELTAWHKMLIGTTKEIKAMKSKGLDLEAMQKKGLSKKWDTYTKGFINTPTWIMLVNSSLDH